MWGPRGIGPERERRGGEGKNQGRRRGPGERERERENVSLGESDSIIDFREKNEVSKTGLP